MIHSGVVDSNELEMESCVIWRELLSWQLNIMTSLNHDPTQERGLSGFEMVCLGMHAGLSSLCDRTANVLKIPPLLDAMISELNVCFDSVFQ